MRTQLFYKFPLFILTLFCISACSDSFMDPKPGKDGIIVEYSDTTYVWAKASRNSIGEINIPQAGNSSFSVIAFPTWMDGIGYEGRFTNGKALINTSLRENNSPKTGELILQIESLGLMKINLRLFPIGTPVPGSEGTVSIEGTVSDAKYVKSSDLLLITTQMPNQLIVYDTKKGNISKLDLGKRPSCLSVSEDGKTVIIGSGGLISLINLSNLSLQKEFEASFNVFDVALGDNGYAYYTSEHSSSLFYIDLNTGELKETYYYSISNSSHIAKEKGKPSLLVMSYSSRFSVINITDKAPSDEKYWDLQNSFGPRFWFTEEGKYTIGNESYIVSTPTFDTGNYIYTEASLRNGSLNYSFWIDHCAKTHSYFTIKSLSGWDAEKQIIAYKDNSTFALQATYPYSDYVVESGANKNVFSTQPQYVFANESGSSIFLIKNAPLSNPDNAWSIEKIKVQ